MWWNPIPNIYIPDIGGYNSMMSLHMGFQMHTTDEINLISDPQAKNSESPAKLEGITFLSLIGIPSSLMH